MLCDAVIIFDTHCNDFILYEHKYPFVLPLENMLLTRGVKYMDKLAFLGLFASIGGLVFYFTSGAFSIISDSLGLLFQTLGIVLIYIGIGLVIWYILSSINIFLESLGRRT